MRATYLLCASVRIKARRETTSLQLKQFSYLFSLTDSLSWQTCGKMAAFNECLVRLFVALLRLRLARNTDERLGEIHFFEYDWVLGIAQGVASSGSLQPDQRNDITGAGCFNVLTLVGVHQNHSTKTLLLLRAWVDAHVARLDLRGTRGDVKRFTEVWDCIAASTEDFENAQGDTLTSEGQRDQNNRTCTPQTYPWRVVTDKRKYRFDSLRAYA